MPNFLCEFKMIRDTTLTQHYTVETIVPCKLI